MSLILKSFLTFSLILNCAWAENTALRKEALKFWDARDQKESLEQAIVKFEQLHKETPTDTEYLVYLTRALFLKGVNFGKDKDERMDLFEKAFEYGERALETNAEYASRKKKNDDVKYMVKALGINEVPQMYWTAVSIGKFAKANGIMSSLKYKSKILALIERVEELKPDYFYGAVDRYWGAYFAVIPSIIGKDLKKSKKHFEKSQAMGPEYVGTKVLKAETYYVEKEDKKGFKEILSEVLADKSHDHHPELGPENRLEKIKAQKLLDDVKELF